MVKQVFINVPQVLKTLSIRIHNHSTPMAEIKGSSYSKYFSMIEIVQFHIMELASRDVIKLQLSF